MTVRRIALLAVLLTAGTARAQVPAVPGVPPVPAAPAAVPAAAPAAAVPAPTRNLWSFLLPSQSQCAACKQKFCSCGLGQLLNSMLTPVSGLTGGVIGPLCPPNSQANPADLAKPADSAQGAAARIKQEEAEAKARIAAIRYLATVDCRYYPEAQAALINGLRADKNECVRIEAAKALLNGCCCNKLVIAALTRSVNGDEKDGHVGERSECVRAVAFLALQRCLSCYVEPPPVQPEPGESPEKKEKAGAAGGEVLFAAYYRRANEGPSDRVLGEARATVGRGLAISRDTLWRLNTPSSLAAVARGVPGGIPASRPVVAPTAPVAEEAPAPKRSLAQMWRDSVKREPSAE